MTLRIKNLTKRFAGQLALENINLSPENSVVAILGANGSGKSTLLKILATLIKPDSGDIQFNALDYAQHQRELRTQIGYLPQEIEFPELLTPRKLLSHLAALRGGNVAQIIAQFQLDTIADRHFQQLSSGQIRLVSIAQTLLGSPRLLLLDELSQGLDVLQRERIFRILKADNRLILFSTHIPNEIEWAGAQTVIILNCGKVLYCGGTEKLLELAKGSIYELDIPEDRQHFYDTNFAVSRRTSLKNGQLRLRIVGQPPQSNLTSVSPTLEDAYLFVVRSAACGYTANTAGTASSDKTLKSL